MWGWVSIPNNRLQTNKEAIRKPVKFHGCFAVPRLHRKLLSNSEKDPSLKQRRGLHVILDVNLSANLRDPTHLLRCAQAHLAAAFGATLLRIRCLRCRTPDLTDGHFRP